MRNVGENSLQWQIRLVEKAIQFQLGDIDDNSKFEIDFGDYDFKTEIPSVLSLLFKDPLFRECFPQFNFQYPIPPRVNSSLSEEMQGRILKIVEQLSDETLISMNGRKSSPWRKMSRSKIPFVYCIVIVINAPFVADLCKAWMMATTIFSPAEFIARQREHQSKAFNFFPSHEDPRLKFLLNLSDHFGTSVHSNEFSKLVFMVLSELTVLNERIEKYFSSTASSRRGSIEGARANFVVSMRDLIEVILDPVRDDFKQADYGRQNGVSIITDILNSKMMMEFFELEQKIGAKYVENILRNRNTPLKSP